ncbi:MAG TPA: type II CAAX endopeptidase family protein [Vicinamibacterales bacterium]
MEAELPGEPLPPGAPPVIVPDAAAGRPRTDRWLALLEVCLCSGFPTQLGLILLLGAAGIAPAADGQLSLRFVAALSALDSVLIAVLVFAFLRRTGESPRHVLLGRRPVIAETGLGLLLLPIVFLVVAVTALVISRWAPWLHQPENPFADLLSTRTGLVVFAVIGMVAGGVREELQRAFILHRSEQYLGGAIVGLVGFSVIFGLGHLLQGWGAVFITAFLGLFWGLVYLARRSIIAPVVCHAAFNLVEVVGFGLLR